MVIKNICSYALHLVLNESIFLVISYDMYIFVCLKRGHHWYLIWETDELSDEDLIYLDELKRCFEGENLSKVNESQIKN